MANPQTQAAAGAAAQTTETAGLLDEIIGKGFKPQEQQEADRAKTYFAQFLQQAVTGQVVSKDVEQNIKHWIRTLDEKLTGQLNAVMHNEAFQKLEGTWRGLHYLVHQSETGTQLKIRVFNAKKTEVQRDLERAIEFDQSQLFKKVYEDEYGVLGGTPYGLLVGDYEFGRGPEDVNLLKQMSNLAAACHAPFVTNTSPKMYGFDRWTELSNPRDLAKIFEGVEYAAFKSFRESEDSRYVALTLPRVLGRLPYGKEFKRVAEFDFEESVDGTNHDKYLWMGAAWAYATRITDAFAKDGWFARIRGVEGGGKVEGLPVHTFPTDDGDVAMKCPTEIGITERREQELEKLGFLSLVHCKGQPFAAFMSGTSCQKPKKYDRDSATANAMLSTKFNQLMCVSRFAHFLKVMVRNRIGSFMEREDMERWLNRWINNYTLGNPDSASEETKAQKPLAWAEIKVVDVPGQPGVYRAVAHMRPHFQLEQLDISLRMVAKQLGK